MNEAIPEQLIVCAGDCVKPLCANALEEFLREPHQNMHKFVMSEWLGEHQFGKAALLWIVDDSAPWDTVHLALRNRIPLLVAEENVPMKQVCVTAGCGMFYRDASEARLCLEFLLANQAIRQRMGDNGRAYIVR